MDQILKVFVLLMVLVTELHVATAQCTCSCSGMGPSQDVCENPNPPADVSEISLLFSNSLA